MQKFNYHTHTARCKHADYTLTDEDYVLNFINLGFEKIAFTDHAPWKDNIDKRTRMRMDYSEINNYLESVNNLKEKYKDKIEIESGFEIEYLKDRENELLELKGKCDKLVLGQHFIYNKNKDDLLIFRYHNFTDNELLEYANYITEAIEKRIPDIIVHPDLYMINRDNFGEIESAVAHTICKAAEKYNIPLEINISDAAMCIAKYKNKIDYPCKKFWEIASLYNIKVLYGMDTHHLYQFINYETSLQTVNDIIGENTLSKLKFINKEDM